MHDLQAKALEVKRLYDELNSQKGEQAWTYREYTEGLVGDVGDLVKLVMAKANFRGADGDVDELLSHELADCLWSLLVISNELGIDLETEFAKNMDTLKERVSQKLKS